MADRTAQLERRVSELESDVRRLRLRIEQMLSRKGGHVAGQVHVEGWLQLEEQTLSGTPSSGCVRIQAVDSGGILQLIAIFPTGHVEVLGQE